MAYCMCYALTTPSCREIFVRCVFMSDCIFCKIARHEIGSNIVYEDDEIIAFKDLSPQAPVHVLVIPKTHISGLLELTGNAPQVVGRIVSEIVPRLARELGIADGGFRVVVNTGEDGGQTVGHLHFHLLGGRSMTWPPG